MPIDNYLAFVPTLPPFGGLEVWIGPVGTPIAGTVEVNNVTIDIPTQVVPLAPDQLNFVYVDLSVGAIQTSSFDFIDPAAGFPSNVYPIAVLKTDASGVLDMADSRPDIWPVGGGVGSSQDTVVPYTTPQTISIIAGQNIFGTCTQAANPLALPPASSIIAGQRISLVKIDAVGYIAITGGGQGTFYLTNQNQYVNFKCDGTYWWIVGNSN